MLTAVDRPDDPIVRAFQIASSGKATCFADITARLKSEGYSLLTMESRSLRSQLAALIKKSREPNA